MADKISNNPLAQSALIFLICAVGILAFLFLIVLPSQKTAAELDREIDALNARIEAHPDTGVSQPVESGKDRGPFSAAVA